MKTKQQHIDLLNETAAFYNSKNRSVKYIAPSQCTFFNEGTSPGCAIGRLIKDKELCKQLDYMTLTELRSFAEIYELLPPELKEYNQEFLIDLQALHDKPENWNESGLSEIGKYRRNHIETWIKNNNEIPDTN
jgi:hypothetical protein